MTKTPLFLLLFFGIKTIFCGVIEYGSQKTYPNLCTHNDCKELASEIQNYMDESVDPCQDFYKFSCGNYIKNVNATGNLKHHTGITRTIIMKHHERLLQYSSTPIRAEDNFLMKKLKEVYQDYLTALRDSYSDDFEKKLVLASVLIKAFPVLFLSMEIKTNKMWIEHKKAVEELFDYINADYIEEFQKVGYDTNELEEIKKFLTEHLKVGIGFGDQILEDGSVENYYKNIDLENKSLDDRLAALRELQEPKWWRELSKTKVEDRIALRDGKFKQNVSWVHSGDYLAGFSHYNRFMTSVVIPIWFLAPPFFSPNYPESINFGRLGFIIGHELYHALEAHPLRRDNRRMMNNECSTHQYDGLINSAGEKINGSVTLNENVADNAGIRVAYNAYKKLFDNGSFSDSRLPGVEYSASQLFWIGAATRFCTTRLSNPQGVHSTADVRINVAFSNMREFADDFRCKMGSKMNPEKVCQALK